MNSTDRIEFTQGLMLLAEIYNRKLSELLLQAYWDCLKSYSLASFKQVLCHFLKNPDSANHGFPSPAAWIKVLEGDSQAKGLAAWTKVIRAIRYVGQYESVTFNDPITHAVINDMGGWIFLCKQPERELIFLQKEFERRYVNYASRKKIPATTEYLTGYIAHQNRVHGFEQAVPIPVKISTAQKFLVKHSDEE
jgi:hypothetical protein